MYFSNTIKQTNYLTNIQLVLLFYRCILISRCDNQVNNVKKKGFLIPLPKVAQRNSHYRYNIGSTEFKKTLEKFHRASIL